MKISARLGLGALCCLLSMSATAVAWDAVKLSAYPQNLAGHRYLPDDQVRQILPDAHGGVWMGRYHKFIVGE